METIADHHVVAAGDDCSNGPVFIVGMNGSGTTMLLDSLGRHSQLYGFPRETRLMPHVIMSIRRLGDLEDDENWRQAWQLACDIPAVKFVNGGKAPSVPHDWRAQPREAGVIFECLFGAFAAPHDKERWCEKTPQHVQHLDLLSTVFPTAKFIHIIRDGRACAASFSQRWRRTPRLTIYRWKKVVRIGRERGHRLADRYLEVHYEKLTQDPELWMRRIFDFLSLDFEPAVLESSNPQSRERGTAGKISARPEAWRTHFCGSGIRRLEHIAGAYLEELGYQTICEKGDAEPTAWRRKFWRAKDGFWLWMLEIRRKLQGSRKPWSRVLTQPLESIRQARSNDH